MKNLNKSFKKYLSVKILLILVFMSFISSCSARVSSPAVNIFNQSDDYIYNIKGRWNGYVFARWQERTPGINSSENFILEKESDLFGPVHLEWENAQGKKLTKEFEFKKEQMPNFHKGKYGRGNIYFFFTQEDVKMIVRTDGATLDIVDKDWDLTNQIRDDYLFICYPPAYGNPPVGDDRPPVSSEACKSLMPLYQPKNMPKINKARKREEEKEKQRLENIREYQEKKKQEKEK
jgi:hypothetical protein